MRFCELLRELCRDSSGAAAIEYALIASLVSIAAVTTLYALGLSVEDIYRVVAENFPEL